MGYQHPQLLLKHAPGGSKYVAMPHWPDANGSSNEYHPTKFEEVYPDVPEDLDPKTSQVIG